MKRILNKTGQVGLLSVILCFLFSLSVAAQKGNMPPPIIDAHLHAFKIMPGETMVNFKAPCSQKKYGNQVLALLRKYNIRAFTSGDDSVLRNWEVKEPGRILPGKLVWSPEQINMDQLMQAIKDKKWDVIGEVLTQYEGLRANDPSIDPLYALAEQMDVPLGIHMGFGPPGAAYIPMFRNFRVSLIHPFYLEDVLIKHPKLRLYVCHAGYPMIGEMIAMLSAFPQLYVDIAAIDWVLPQKEFYYYLERLVNAGYEKRILFGSDEMNWPEGIEISIKNIREAPFLSKEEKRDIFYNNAVRFFRLKETKEKR